MGEFWLNFVGACLGYMAYDGLKLAWRRWRAFARSRR